MAAAGSVLILAGAAAGCGGSSGATAPTATPVAAGTRLPAAVHGLGLTDTRIVAARAPWRIDWHYSCDNLGKGGDPDQPTRSKGTVAVQSFKIALIGTGATAGHSIPLHHSGGDGDGTLTVHHSGSYLVRVITDCAWRLRMGGA